jgi:hypothetical protein
MEDHKKMLSIQILIEVEVEVLKPNFEDDTEARMVDIINMKVSLMELVATLALGESVRVCEDEDSHSQVSSHFGSWSPVDSQTFIKRLQGSKHLIVKSALYH